MREPEDRNKDDPESVLYFLVDKTFNHLVVFIYNSHSDPSVPLRCEFQSFLWFRLPSPSW